MRFSRRDYWFLKHITFLPCLFSLIFHALLTSYYCFSYIAVEFHPLIYINGIICIFYLFSLIFNTGKSNLFWTSFLVAEIIIYSFIEVLYLHVVNGSEIIILALIPSVFLFNCERNIPKLYYFIMNGIVFAALIIILYFQVLWAPSDRLFLRYRWMYFVFRQLLSIFYTITLLVYEGFVAAIEIRHSNNKSKRLQHSLEFSAHHDTLTALMNRDRTLQIFRQCELKKDSEGIEYAIAIFDIDNFKKINDIYGHDAGDAVLRIYSRRIWNHYPDPVKVGRWGGEEFLIIFPSINDKTVYALNEVRDKLSKQPVVFNGQKIAVTATYGISSSRNFSSAIDVLNDADANLLEGKNNGKNRLVVSEKF